MKSKQETGKRRRTKKKKNLYESSFIGLTRKHDSGTLLFKCQTWEQFSKGSQLNWPDVVDMFWLRSDVANYSAYDKPPEQDIQFKLLFYFLGNRKR